jgi:CubicO group peptidase (beta-lactamase class C family)
MKVDISKWADGIARPMNFINKVYSMPYNRFMQRVETPRNLDKVITIDHAKEYDPVSLGMTMRGVNEIWNAVKELYRTGMFPAVSFCLRRHGKVILKRAIGYSRGIGPEEKNDEKQLMTTETPVCLFSSTKAVSAMLVHLLSERKQLSLMDPISYYIPEFGQNGKKGISIYQLLTHQAGIPRLPDLHPGELKEIIFNHEEIIRRLCAMRADRPGHHTGYHAFTAGYIIGEIVNRVNGKDCREFLKENIQSPLGFRYFNYGINPEDADKVAKNYFTGLPIFFPFSLYEKRTIGSTIKDTIYLFNDPQILDIVMPAGNIYATADECTQFFQLLLNGGVFNDVRIFKPLTIRRATVETGKPEIDNTLLIPIRYSAGMMLGNSPFGLYGPETKKAYGHMGITTNMVWADPERDISVALLTTGKVLLGFHYWPLFRLLASISRHCSRMSRADQETIAKARGMDNPMGTCWC